MLKVLEVMDIIKVVVGLGVCLFFGFKCANIMYEKNRSRGGGFCLGFFLTWVGYIICRCKKYHVADEFKYDDSKVSYRTNSTGNYTDKDFTWWRCSCGTINSNDVKICDYCGENRPA